MDVIVCIILRSQTELGQNTPCQGERRVSVNLAGLGRLRETAEEAMKRDQVLEILAEHKEELKQHGVKSIALFGSVARGEDSAKSDVDILVEFDQVRNKIGLFAFVRLRRRLEEMLGIRVDLVTPKALKRQLKAQILEEAIYAG